MGIVQNACINIVCYEPLVIMYVCMNLSWNGLSFSTTFRAFARICSESDQSFEKTMNCRCKMILYSVHIMPRTQRPTKPNSFEHELFHPVALATSDVREHCFQCWCYMLRLRVYLTFVVTNCSAERSFTTMSRVKRQIRTSVHEWRRLNVLSLLCIKYEVMHSIYFGETIKILRTKARKVPVKWNYFSYD